VRRQAKASSAGSPDGDGSSRGLVRRALAPRGSSGHVKGSGARSVRGLSAAAFATVALLASLVCVPAASAAPPSVTIEPASEVGFTNVKAKGTVNPGGKETSWHFEYMTDAAFQAHTNETQGITVFSGGPSTATFFLSFKGQKTGPIATGTPSAAVESALNALSTIGAAGGSVTVAGAESHYEVTFGGSFAETDVPSLEYSSLEVGGFPEDNLLPAHAPGFGGATPAGGGTLSAEEPVSTVIENLVAGTTYHLRLVAENADSAGVPSTAVASTFTTSTATPPVLALNPATASYATAHVSATIDPEGGNVNPIDGAVPIRWELQYSSDPVNNGWAQAKEETLTGSQATSSSPVTVEADIGSLAPKTTYSYRLVVYYAGLTGQTGASTFETLEVAKPTISIDPVTTFTITTAHISGHINPNAPGAAPQDPAFDTNWHFQCTPDCPEISGDTSPILADNTSHTVSIDVSNLNPGTHYEVTLFASNLGGEETAGPVTFNTPAVAPKVKTGDAHVTADGATLAGKINPGGALTAYHFEYEALAGGPVENTPTLNLPPGNELVGVGATLSGLSPDTQYRYRLVAINSVSTVNGAYRVLTTAKAVEPGCLNAAVRTQQGSTRLPECRAYEIVNTPGLDLGDVIGTPIVSDDGEHVLYASEVPGDNAGGAGLASYTLAQRTPSGWQSTNADPYSLGPTNSTGLTVVKAFSADFSRGLFGSTFPMDAGDKNNFEDLYRTDVGSTTTTWMSPNTGPYVSVFAGASRDLDRAVFVFASDPPALVESDGNGVELLSVFPPDLQTGGFFYPAPAGGQWSRGLGEGNDVGPAVEHGGAHGVSDDAQRVYFYRGPVGSSLFVRDLASSPKRTVAVTTSERTADAGKSALDRLAGGEFISASHDGSQAYFASAAQLTDAATPGGGIYRFDLEAPEGHRLEQITPDANDLGGLHLTSALASDDQSHIYFVSSADLGGGAVAGETNAYVWTAAGVRFIDNVGSDAKFERVTVDGRFALLYSTASIGGAPNNGKEAIYEYSYAANELACASCRPDGSPSQGGAGLVASPPVISPVIVSNRGLSADGHVLFLSNDQIVPADQNEASDVYLYHGGNVALLSSGRDEADSYPGNISEDAKNVSLITRAKLAGADRDPDEYDVYDARVDGGFLEPPPLPAPCEGEGCRDAGSSKPPAAAPSTLNFIGTGNPRKCPKGKTLRNARCVAVKSRGHQKKHKHKSHKRNAKGNGRTGR
jgi:hypothetical protein